MPWMNTIPRSYSTPGSPPMVLPVSCADAVVRLRDVPRPPDAIGNTLAPGSDIASQATNFPHCVQVTPWVWTPATTAARADEITTASGALPGRGIRHSCRLTRADRRRHVLARVPGARTRCVFTIVRRQLRLSDSRSGDARFSSHLVYVKDVLDLPQFGMA